MYIRLFEFLRALNQKCSAMNLHCKLFTLFSVTNNRVNFSEVINKFLTRRCVCKSNLISESSVSLQ